jgi:hypothetical protein
VFDVLAENNREICADQHFGVSVSASHLPT